jgi:hypothetical protein
MSINIEDLTIKEIKEISALIQGVNKESLSSHPFIGRKVLVRTYSAGVHIGTLEKINGMECHLKNALRLWKWEGGGLSLSAVAANGIKGGRLNKCAEIYLTNCIEFIPVTSEAEKSYEKFIED